jgi:hypothetical protein
MAIRTYSLKLEGLDVPPGEILLSDLATLGASLQLTATRIARQIIGADGPGRTPAFFDRISEIRLTKIGIGSTVLELEIGDEEALPVPDGEESVFMERFEDAFRAIAVNQPPKWASPQVRVAIGRVAASLSSIGAGRAVASWGDGPSRTQEIIDVPELDSTVWVVERDQRDEVVSMTGILDKVDLRARRFRVRDDLGNDVVLEDVIDVAAAAQLIGRRVEASGLAERREGRLARIVEPTLSLESLPEDWIRPAVLELPRAGRPPSGGVPGVSSDDIDEFLAGLRT